MGKYSDALLGSTPTPKTSKTKWSDLLLDGGKSEQPKFIENPDIRDTSQISAITGKPEQEYVANNYQPASMATLAQAGFIDNNDSKIKLFAEARGIDPERYRVKNGKIWFESDEGTNIFYPESPKSVDGVLKKFLAGVPSELPAELGAVAGGLTFGVPGATAGAAAGEFVRKTIGRSMGDEQTAMDYATDMGVNALLGGLDVGVARAIAGKLSKAKISHATKGALTDSLKNVVGDIAPEQKAAGRVLSRKGREIGVDLKPHQAMDDPTLTSYYEMLRQNPKTSRQVIESDKTLDSQVEQAGGDLLRKIYDGETSPFEVGAELSDAGAQIIQKSKDARSSAARPFYDKARKIDGVDIAPALEKIAELRQTAKPGMKINTALNRIEKMLYIKDGGGLVPEGRVEVLDRVKKEIDNILRGRDSGAITTDVKRQMMEVKDALTAQADAISPDYQQGRKIYSEMSPDIEKQEAGVLGKLAGLKNDSTKEAAVKHIFRSTHDVKVARAAIEKENPDLWRKAVAEYMRDGLSSVSNPNQAGVNIVNRGGKYGQWGHLKKKRLKAATEGMVDGDGGPLYDRINDFFEVMEAASIGHKTNSTTASQQQFRKELGGLAGKVGSVAANPLQSAINIFFKGAEGRTFDKNAQKLLDLMQTQEGVELIARAKGFGPNTKRGLEAAATFILMATQKNIDDGISLYQAIKDPGEQRQGL